MSGTGPWASMRILFLAKRHYMGKDLLRDRYGRFYELPLALAAQGADVTVSCLDYYRATDNALNYREGDVAWHSAYIGRNPVAGMYRYYWRLRRLVQENKPQIIIGASDSIHIILAARLARKFNLPCCLDLYDNFESYGQMKLPGLKHYYRAALGRVDAITVVSAPLQKLIMDTCRPSGRVEVLENAVPDGLFFPSDKAAARKELGLPDTGRLLGTAGSLYRSRDIESLYRAFLQLTLRNDDLRLVLAGGVDRKLSVPAHDRIIYLGDLDYDRVPMLYNALDLGIICNRDDSFGRYCFPQKLYEMIACRLPVVAAGVGVALDLFRDHPKCLYQPGNSVDLERAVELQLQARLTLDLPVPAWSTQGAKLLHIINELGAVAG
jgi:teichuronic acid biosynthesis glycosyltransferase TuaC